MKIFFTLFSFFIAHIALAAEPMLQESEYKYVAQSIGKGKPYFLEVGSDSCHSCQVMGTMLLQITQKHPEYNIHFINVKKEREAAYALNVRMIPTQIIYDKEGKEVYRHIGVLSGDELAGLLKSFGF